MKDKKLVDENEYFKVSIYLFTTIGEDIGSFFNINKYRIFLKEIKKTFEELGFRAKTIEKKFVLLKGDFEQIVIDPKELTGFLKENTINEIKRMKNKETYESFEIENIEIKYSTYNYSFLEYYNKLQEIHLKLYKEINVDAHYFNNPFAPYADFNFHQPTLPKEHENLFKEEVKYIKEKKTSV